jgi:hypothetical protein
MSADNSNNPPDDQTTDNQVKGKDALAEQLAGITEMLRVQNEATEARFAALAAQNNQSKRKVEEEDDNLYDPKNLLRKSEEIFSQKLRDEKAKDAMIWDLAQEYPEIKSDTKLRAAVLEAQKSLPENLRDTATGYESAVLKAVSKAGLIPKSKRQSQEEDVSMSPRGGGESRPKGKAKVTQNMLAIAQLMGRDVNDPETIKRLEAAAQRDTFNKFR